VYPFRKPFYDTPYDEDRHKLNSRALDAKPKTYPAWMDHGYDGTGRSIGLHRTHPLSKATGNLQRDAEHVPRVFRAIIQGYAHRSGVTLYTGAKLPRPHTHPYLTGEPCPVYGWRVLEPFVVRQFDTPQVSADKQRYRPYVALHERRIIGESTEASAESARPRRDGGEAKPPATKQQESKPLLKRLFFWQ